MFELQALAGLSGNFQIGAVQRTENGALSMALSAFIELRGSDIFCFVAESERPA